MVLSNVVKDYLTATVEQSWRIKHVPLTELQVEARLNQFLSVGLLKALPKQDNKVYIKEYKWNLNAGNNIGRVVSKYLSIFRCRTH
jgi:hypothetical protein